MLFSELLDSLTPDGSGWRTAVGDDWMQGRSVFGGLQAALALRAMRALVPAEVPLRTLQTTFLAPVPSGAVRIEARVLRSGSSTTGVEARLVDGGETLALMLGVFGRARKSQVARLPQQPALVARKPLELEFVPGLLPNFIQHFGARWLHGGMPFSGGKEPS